MSAEKAVASPSPEADKKALPKGLNPFAWLPFADGVSLMDIQQLNDLTEKYEKEKDPKILARITDVKLATAKSAVEGEIGAYITRYNTANPGANLDRAKLEAEYQAAVAEKRPLDDIHYALVRFLKNYETLEKAVQASRVTEGGAARTEAAAGQSVLKTEVQAQAAKVDAKPAADAGSPTPAESKDRSSADSVLAILKGATKTKAVEKRITTIEAAIKENSAKLPKEVVEAKDVKSLQKALGVSPDGTVGPNTVNALLKKLGIDKKQFVPAYVPPAKKDDGIGDGTKKPALTDDSGRTFDQDRKERAKKAKPVFSLGSDLPTYVDPSVGSLTAIPQAQKAAPVTSDGIGDGTKNSGIPAESEDADYLRAHAHQWGA